VSDPQVVDFNSNRYALPSTLVHDLRTPLNQVMGYSELLLDKEGDAGYDEFAPDLRKVLTAAKQLLGVINDNFESVKVARTNGMIDLPPVESHTEVARSTDLAQLASGTAHGFILVVDDEEGNRDVLSRRLELQGYAVDTAESGERALEMMKADTFDLVLLDILMPGTDGFEVLKSIKAEHKFRNIPVIMISALDELDSVARCIEMGAEDYLSKPFNPTMLRARIGACLEKKRSRDREALLFDELKQNYKRLQELERLRDDLTHMIIHDLRTPLTSLIAGMQTMDSLGDLNEGQREMMMIAVEGGGSLLSMINDLLDVEKLESGALQLEYSSLAAGDVIRTSVDQVAALAEAKGLKIIQKIYEGAPAFEADEKKLRRTLVNLLGNAINFTPPGGVITIDANSADEGRSIMFSVTDTGEGIPADAFDRIFEKFGQVGARKEGRSGGTGLGLTFCKLAVEAHGGKIKVESSGEGSRFSITIPIPRKPEEIGAAQ